MQYTEKDLEQLIDSVTKEFTSHLEKAEEDSKLAKSEATAVEALVKAEDGKEKPAEKKPEAKEAAPEAKEKGHEEKAPEAKEGEAPAAEAKAPEAEAKPEGEAPAHAEAAPAEGEDHCDYDDQDREHMQKMYMSMSKGEIKAHHDACRAALDQKGLAKCGEMSMNKTETAATSIEVKAEIVKPEPNKELELLKSEVSAANAKTEALQKNLDGLQAFLTKLVEKTVPPKGKAITSLEVIAKSEDGKEEKTLTKSDIDSALSKKAQDPKLEKSDRDAINNFYLNGGSLNSISHLLK